MDEKRSKNGGVFAKGNKAAKGHGRPKHDFDIETFCRNASMPIARRFAEMGERGESSADVAAGKVVLEYAWGKAKQRTEVTGANGAPLNGPVFYLPSNGRDAPLEVFPVAAAVTPQANEGDLEADDDEDDDEDDSTGS
jgi:hypothetical protein